MLAPVATEIEPAGSRGMLIGQASINRPVISSRALLGLLSVFIHAAEPHDYGVYLLGVGASVISVFWSAGSAT
jgi:hypothetical protein